MVLKLRCSWSSPVTLGWVTWKLPCGSQVHVSLPHLNPSFYPLWHCFLKHIIPFIYVNELSFLPLNNFFFKWNYTVFYFLFIFFTQWKAGPPSLKLLMSNSSSKIVRGISFIFLKAIENGKRVRKPLLKIIFFSCVWKWRGKVPPWCNSSCQLQTPSPALRYTSSPVSPRARLKAAPAGAAAWLSLGVGWPPERTPDPLSQSLCFHQVLGWFVCPLTCEERGSRMVALTLGCPLEPPGEL